MEHEIPFGNSNRKNGTTFLDFPLFLGIFQWDEPTKRVPFTAEPEIPEILSKWKAPLVSETLHKQSPITAETTKRLQLKNLPTLCNDSSFSVQFSNSVSWTKAILPFTMKIIIKTFEFHASMRPMRSAEYQATIPLKFLIIIHNYANV